MALPAQHRCLLALACLSGCAIAAAPGKPLALEAHGIAHATTETTEVDASMEELVVQLLTRDGRHAPNPDKLVEAGLRKVNVEAAARRLEGRLPSDVASMVKVSVSGKAESRQPFDETSLAKARNYLNKLVEKAWKELDDKLIECKEYESRNRGTFEQVLTDLARLAENIASVEKVKSESTEMINVKEGEMLTANALLKKETDDYNRIRLQNTQEMTIRKNDLAVFQFMMVLVKCKKSSLLQLDQEPKLQICESNGSLELHFGDQKLQADLESRMTPATRAAIRMVLNGVEEVEAEQAAGLLQQEKIRRDSRGDVDSIDDASDDEDDDQAAMSSLGVETDRQGSTSTATTTAGLPTPPMPKTAVQKEVSEDGGAFKCPMGPPDCGLLHDKMSLMWGQFKDKVDELQATMDKNEFVFTELKAGLNLQLEMMRSSKTRFALELSEAVASLAADREETGQKEAQKETLEKEYKTYMAGCKKRIEWIMYQDMCSYIKVRATVMTYSKVSPPDKITDCGTSAWVPSVCSVACDDGCPVKNNPYACGGIQALTREIVVPANEFGLKCPLLVRQRKCNQVKCPVNCVMSHWSQWSKCTRECEGGVQGRTRSVLTVPRNGGSSCNTAQVSQPCHTGSCDRNCELKKWTSWSPCSVACGGGFQERWRRVTIPIRGRGTCPKAKSKVREGLQNCNVHNCVGDEVCIAKQDLVMAIDASGSLTENGFKIVKGFASKLASKYIGKYYGIEDMKIGVVQFGNGEIMPDGTIAQAVEVSPLTSDMAKVKTAIEGMKFMKGFTNMAQAFTLTEKLQLLGGRTTAQSAILTITDGKPSFIFQTNEKVLQLKDKHTKLFFMPITEFKGEEMKLMRKWASTPWETHLVHVPGLLPLSADEGMFAQKALVMFCPESLSPTAEVTQETSVGFMLIRENGRCGTRGQLLAEKVEGGVASCAALAQGAKKTAFSFGIKYVRGKCFAEELAVTATMITSFQKARVDPPCPAGKWEEDGLYDFYVLTSGEAA